MKKIIFLILTMFMFNIVAPASTYNVKSLTEMTDKKPKHKKKKHKKSHKKSHKAKRHAKKKGLVGHGCRGIKALPKTGR